MVWWKRKLQTAVLSPAGAPRNKCVYPYPTLVVGLGGHQQQIPRRLGGSQLAVGDESMSTLKYQILRFFF